MQQTISIIVSGLVQGVFYRQSTKEIANSLGVTGYVMNLPDGNVKIIATGEEDQLEMLVSWCKQGPPDAQVSEIITENIPHEEFSKFSVQRF